LKDYKRLAAGIRGRNDIANQTVILQVEDFDGGEFELHPKVGEQSIVMVDPSRPSGYAWTIVGQPEALTRFANAIHALARRLDGDDGPADTSV
jgi:hypothetical protein